MSCEKWRSPHSSARVAQTGQTFRALTLPCVQTCKKNKNKKKLPNSLSCAGKFPAQTMHADCTTPDAEKDPVCQVLNPGGMESQTNPGTGHRGEGVCQRGCGLLLSGEDIGDGEHCCVDALRSVTDALEGRSATLEHGARMARLRWNRRERSLLAKVTTLQNEAQLAALKYQRRLHQYMLHIDSIAEQVNGYCKVRGLINVMRACGGVTEISRVECHLCSLLSQAWVSCSLKQNLTDKLITFLCLLAELE